MANEWYVQELCIIQPAALKLHKLLYGGNKPQQQEMAFLLGMLDYKHGIKQRVFTKKHTIPQQKQGSNFQQTVKKIDAET